MMRRTCAVVLAFCAIMLGIAERAPGQPSSEVCDCKTRLFGDCFSPEICVRFDNLSGAPEEDFDFSFSFDGSGNPSVDLKRGESTGATLYEWRVWCLDESSGDPEDIVAITGGTSVAQDYDVTILNDSGNAGAADIGTINLNPTGSGTNFSRITDGEITGDFTSTLFLEEDTSGEGGSINMTVKGDFSATSSTIASIEAGDTFKIEGQLKSSLTIDDVVDGTLSIWQGVAGGKTLRIEENLGNITLGGSGYAAIADTGILYLVDGMPSGATHLVCNGPMDGTINLNNSAVASNIALNAGGSGDIINGGAVTAYTVLLAVSEADAYTGDATFASLASGSTIWAKYSGEVHGQVEITGACNGTIRVGSAGNWGGGGDLGDGTNAAKILVGSMGSTGDIEIWGDIAANSDVVVTGANAGTIEIGGAGDDGDIHGGASIDVGSNSSGASILVWGDIEANADVIVSGANAGEIEIGSSTDGLGEVKSGGSIDVGSVSNTGTITTWGDVKNLGKIWVRNDVDGNGTTDGLIRVHKDIDNGGEVAVDGDLDGELHVQNQVLGNITIGGAVTSDRFEIHRMVKSTADITVTGQLNGVLALGDGTEYGSLITLGSIGSSGSLTVNEDLPNDGDPADFDAYGDISVDGAMSGLIHIYGVLGGDIDIDGSSSISGDITIDEATAAISLIDIACGIGAGSTITINDSGGDFDADGDILMGAGQCVTADPMDTPLFYEGCIHVKERFLAIPPAGGDFTGDIEVTVCHESGDDLEFTVEGTDSGNKTINIAHPDDCDDDITWTTCP